ncbi:MAG: serine protease, partial [Gammaproteobacteria bacterium]|nr:serine protease [Gammaproteobacteria bacterium]
MENYKFIISCIIFASFIGVVSFETGYKKGSQEDLSYAAEKAASSVVNIFISNRGINRTRNAVGSGVIFSKEGHIVTNTHILTNATSVFVEF